jgi:hypothetical protein
MRNNATLKAAVATSLLAASCLFADDLSAADWQQLGRIRDSGVTFALDRLSTQGPPENRTVTVAFNYQNKETNGALSQLGFYVVNCVSNQVKAAGGRLNAEHYGEGQSIGRPVNPDTSFQDAPAGTLFGAVRAAVCAERAAPPVPSDERDLLLFVRKVDRYSPFYMVKALDGGDRLADPARLREGVPYSACIYWSTESLTHLGSNERVVGLINTLMHSVVSDLAGGKALSGGCLSPNRPDMIVMQRRKGANDLRDSAGFAEYELLREIQYAALLQLSDEDKARQRLAADQARALAIQAQLAERQRIELLGTLAAADRRDHVASLTLAYPDGNKIRYCTVTNDGAEAVALLGYMHRGEEWMSEAMAARIKERNAGPESRSQFSKVYPSADMFYIEQQTKPDVCHVYVDYSKNVKLVMDAIKRDQKSRTLELNEISPAQAMREAWAQREGYSSWGALELATAIKGDAKLVNRLAEHGITTKNGVDAALAEMRAARYSQSTEVGDLLVYLSDKRSAADGQSAVSLRKARERAAAEASAQREAEGRRRQVTYASEFPFTATLTCGFSGRHVNTVACYADGNLRTQLELRNGSDYKMLQAWEMGQAGRETSEGLVIPLRQNFNLKAQNANESLLLSLRITETATGRVVYEKSASRFGTVGARN